MNSLSRFGSYSNTSWLRASVGAGVTVTAKFVALGIALYVYVFWLVLPVLFHELTTEETMKLFARLAAQTVICLGWDWLSSPSHYNLLFQRADKKPKAKYTIPYYSKNQTKRYCIVPRVAFAARTVRHEGNQRKKPDTPATHTDHSR